VKLFEAANCGTTSGIDGPRPRDFAGRKPSFKIAGKHQLFNEFAGNQRGFMLRRASLTAGLSRRRVKTHLHLRPRLSENRAAQLINLIGRFGTPTIALECSKNCNLQRKLSSGIDNSATVAAFSTKNLPIYLTPGNFKRQSNLSRRKAPLPNGIGMPRMAWYLRELAGILGGNHWRDVLAGLGRAYSVRHLLMFPGDFV